MNFSRYWQSLLLVVVGLAWSLPAGAVTIKQVLTASQTMGSTPTTVTLASSVDPTKSFVVCYNRTSTNSNPTELATCELGTGTYPVANPTNQLTITTGVADANDTVIWYVVEFSSGVTVQRGISPFGTSGGGPTSGMPTLSPGVDASHSFPIITERVLSTDTDQTHDEDWTVRAVMLPLSCTTSCTTLDLTRNLNTTLTYPPAVHLSPSVAWQVVSSTGTDFDVHPPSRALTGNSNISSGNPSSNAAIASVNINQTFVAFSRKAAATCGGADSQYQTSCALCTCAPPCTCSGSSTTITCTRLTTGTAVTADSYAVQMTDCSSVQSGITTLAAGTGTLDVLIGSITVGNSVPIISVSGGPVGTAGLSDTSVTASFPDATHLRLQRGTSSASVTVSWFVVQFPGSSSLIDKQEIIP